MSQANSAEEHKLVSSFESIRKTLLQDEYRDRLDKPLAYWALPNDRRLPLAFLGRSLGELLQSSFTELSATRGIGQKKISSLVRLLHRATNEAPPTVPYGLKDLADEFEAKRMAASSNGQAEVNGFDPTTVSEGMWAEWRLTVKKFRLGRETLGRLAPSLQLLPTVIWNRPLCLYEDKTLAEIRQMRTHGEKRVRVVMEIFYSVHQMLKGAERGNHLSFSLVPAFVPPAEDYLSELARQETVAVTREEFANALVKPLLRQIKCDSGEAVYMLAVDRLGIGVPVKSVRDQAQDLGVTRARVYQLLEDCSRIMAVRWPNGGQLIRSLGKFEHKDTGKLATATRRLFFPAKGDPVMDGE